jgi:hypothetical protein
MARKSYTTHEGRRDVLPHRRSHGFPDCEKVRAANSNREWGNRPYLEGTELDLLIPPTEEGTDTEPDKSDTEYKLENYPPPSVRFIRSKAPGIPRAARARRQGI